VVYWCNSYTIVHFSLYIIEWFKYKLKKVFKLYLILIHPPLSINRFMEELGKKQENNMLYCDSENVIHLAKKSAFHSNTKHIQLRYHFIQSILEDGHLNLEKIHTSQDPTDMLTKGVTREKLSSFSVLVGIQA
jgi:hypothetical protein